MDNPNHAWKDREAAQRMSDGLKLHHQVRSLTDLFQGKGHHAYVAVSLFDGTVDPSLYDTRDDAIKHQCVALDGNKVAYVKLPPEHWGPQVCDTLIAYARASYVQGYRPVTSHAGAQLILPLLKEHGVAR